MSKSGDVASEHPGQDDESASNALSAITAEARAVIVDELTHRDPALLADLRGAQEPTAEQRDAVERLLASAVINNMGADWTPNEHGLAVERAVKTFLECGRRTDNRWASKGVERRPNHRSTKTMAGPGTTARRNP
jgi:hypothetical protein